MTEIFYSRIVPRQILATTLPMNTYMDTNAPTLQFDVLRGLNSIHSHACENGGYSELIMQFVGHLHSALFIKIAVDRRWSGE